MRLFKSSGAFSQVQHVSRGVALIASAGAAVVSLVAGLYTYGIIGHRESHRTIGNIGAAWVRIKPSIDTASAIGDTVHFAATVADKAGSILVGAVPVWTTGDTAVAVAAADGSIIARGPGTTTISAVAGEVIGGAQIVVRQQVRGVAIVNPTGDSTATVNEGDQLQLRAHALDARGHAVPGRLATWKLDDTTDATVDSHGLVTAKSTGRVLVSVSVDGASAFLPVTVASPATALVVLAGADQAGPAGHLLPQRIVVRATNRRGGPASGKTITFRTRAGLGRAEPQSLKTDADGRARTQWTLGDTPGAQRLFASVDNVDSATAIDAEAEPVAKNTRVSPLTPKLQGQAGVPLDSAGVRVTDSTGRALPGVLVKFSAIDGRVAPTDARTDSSGVARTQWTLGGRVGSQRLKAFVGPAESQIAPTTIVAKATAGAAAVLTVVSGDKQRGAVTKALAKAVVIRVSDAAANVTAGARVLVSVSGGMAEDSVSVSDEDGIARVHWTMPRESGEMVLTARVEGGKAVARVVAHAVPTSPANLDFEEVKGTGKARRWSCLVTDVYGNPVPDVVVGFSLPEGSVTPARGATDARGRVVVSVTGRGELRGVVRGTDVVGKIGVK